MLEERLSNTYAQHTLGAYGSFQAPQQQQQPPQDVYPSISSQVPDGRAGGAEGFYYGTAPAGQYASPAPSHSQHGQQPSFGSGPGRPSASVSSPAPYPAQPQQQANVQRQHWDQQAAYNAHAQHGQTSATPSSTGGSATAQGQQGPASFYNMAQQPNPSMQDFGDRSKTRQSSIDTYQESPLQRHSTQIQHPAQNPSHHAHPSQSIPPDFANAQPGTYPPQQGMYPPTGGYQEVPTPRPQTTTQATPESYNWQTPGGLPQYANTPKPNDPSQEFAGSGMQGNYQGGTQQYLQKHEPAPQKPVEESLIDL